MYEIRTFRPEQAQELAIFLNNLRCRTWTLSSFGFQRQPENISLIGSKELIEENCHNDRIATFILYRCNEIISAAKLDDKLGDGNIVVISGVDTDPVYQKRGVFGNSLGKYCIRETIRRHFLRIEIETWSFNRKGIPFYKRGGFRAVPGTNLLMENYLPSIVKHPDTQAYFDRYDYIRTLQNERSYGYDAIEVNGLSVFEYCWKPRKSNDTLRVLVDWQKKEIVQVECKVMERSAMIEEKCDV
jgi:hypothetical protein